MRVSGHGRKRASIDPMRTRRTLISIKSEQAMFSRNELPMTTR